MGFRGVNTGRESLDFWAFPRLRFLRLSPITGTMAGLGFFNRRARRTVNSTSTIKCVEFVNNSIDPTPFNAPICMNQPTAYYI